MRQITHLVLLSALAVVSTPILGQKAFPQGGELLTAGPHTAMVTEEILQLEHMYNEAIIRPTAEQIERLHTDDFMMTARGTVTTRAELLARLNDPGHPRDVIESLTTDDLKVRIYGDTAVTTARWKRISKDTSGKDTSANGFFTHVWVRQNKRWQMAVAHYSLIAKQ
jgi:ketosteroid isomerase-like protein